MASSDSLVSIVIPCFNAGETLEDTVRSALAQTHSATEVIVVDDGSSDPATLELLRRCPWPGVRVLRQDNAGPAAARNRAIASASGRYILPLDADDLIDPSYVEKAVAVLDSEPGVGIVYCKAAKFGAESGPWQLPAYALRELVIDNVIFVTSLFRRDDWVQVGGFSESLRRGVEDYDFWIKIVAMGREVRQLDECLFHYRVGHASRTTGFNADRQAVVETYAEIFRNNLAFFGRNAEMLFEHRFGLYDELARYRSRYGWLERQFARRPWLLVLAKRVRRLLSAGARR